MLGLSTARISALMLLVLMGNMVCELCAEYRRPSEERWKSRWGREEMRQQAAEEQEVSEMTTTIAQTPCSALNGGAAPAQLRRTAIDWARLARDWPAETVARLQRVIEVCRPFEDNLRPLYGHLDPINEIARLAGNKRAQVVAAPDKTKNHTLTAVTSCRCEHQLRSTATIMLADPATRECAEAIIEAFVVDAAMSTATHLDLAAVLRCLGEWIKKAQAEATDPSALAQQQAQWGRTVLAAHRTDANALDVGGDPGQKTNAITMVVVAQETPRAAWERREVEHQDGLVPIPVGRLTV